MMQYTGNSFDDAAVAPSEEEIQTLMTQKAHELFGVCDTEEKGFITKRDMQRLQSELPLKPDQLEDVFDSLDDDGNGFLTLEEFTQGFGSFLGLRPSSDVSADMTSDTMYMDDCTDDPQEEEQQFHQTMDHLGASTILEGDSTVKSLWCRLKKDDPEMASTFEDFVYRMSNEIKKSKSDFETLEDALRSKTNAHDEEVRKLYEEMETQIKQEKDKILQEEKHKERQLREAMEQEVAEKDRQLQDLVTKHTEMEDKLGYLNTVEAETKVEREKLAQEKEQLEEAYMASQTTLTECQSYINQLREQQKSDKRERARAALKLSEGIALERETLVEQLEKLKYMNRKLQDEKDEASLRRDCSIQNSSLSMEEEVAEASTKNSPRKKADLERQGSILGKYFNTGRIPKSSRSESIKEDVMLERHADSIEEDDFECDDEVYIDNHPPSFTHHTMSSTPSYHQQTPSYHHDNASPIIHRYPGDDREHRGTPTDNHNGRAGSMDYNREDIVEENMVATQGQTSESAPRPSGVQTQQSQHVKGQSHNSIQSGQGHSFTEGQSQVQGHNTHSTDEYNPEMGPPNPGYQQCSNNATETISGQRHASLTSGEHLSQGQGQEMVTFNSNGGYDYSASTADLQGATLSPHSRDAVYQSGTAASMSRLCKSESNLYTPDSPRTQPVGADEPQHAESQSTIAPVQLQRIFKVVFVGDSGVGKSSFIHRFCREQFLATFTATVGVDFQIKSLPIEDQLIVLQLWDTAGQERFRSITKQYFRKADGVVIMYDVTKELSFTSVRNWMVSVKEGVSEDAVLLLLGNKTDLPDNEDSKQVSMKNGSQLADEYGLLFFETSALSGDNVAESMEAMARILKEKEDKQIEQSFKLVDNVEKKGCCS